MLLPLLLGQGTAGPVTHDTSGALGGQAAQVVGAATNFTPHATSGVLAGQTATIAGAADRQAAAVPHTTSGALTGQGSTVAGSSARFHAFGTSGVLTGAGATVVGSADRETAIIPHTSSGTLTGPGSAIAGSATRFRAFASSGVLPGQEALIVGDADVQITIEHDASGDLVGPDSVITGTAETAQIMVPQRGDGVDARWTKKQRRERDRKLAEERDRKGDLRQLLKRALDPVAEASEVEVVTVDDGVVVIPAAGQPVAVPRPEGVDLRAMSREIGKILSDAKVQAERTRRAQSMEVARVALEQARENVRRLLRKRRQEEFLLLMN